MTVKRPFDPDAMPVWLAKLWPGHAQGARIIAGVNDDDCAVMHWGSELLVITTDFLNSSPMAIQLGIGGLRVLGRLLVAANVADLLSTGADPQAMLIGVTMPRGASEDEFKTLMKGIQFEARKWGVAVVGGDSKIGDALAILAVAMGSAKSRKNLFLKNAARPGDLLWVSGDLGSCSAAVIGLKDACMSAAWEKWAVNALTVPNLPFDQSRTLAKLGLGHGGIDVSDGLGEDLYRLCEASGTGVILDAECVPVHRRATALAKAKGTQAWALPFASGGEYQFLVTTSRRIRSKMLLSGFHLIGEITESRKALIRLGDGRLHDLPRTGHRDARGVSFYDEVQSLMKDISHG